MNRDLVHLNELARRLRVPAAWLRREAKSGTLPHVRAGAQYLFDAPTVERVLAERAAKPTPREEVPEDLDAGRADIARMRP